VEEKKTRLPRGQAKVESAHYRLGFLSRQQANGGPDGPKGRARKGETILTSQVRRKRSKSVKGGRGKISCGQL